MRGLPPVDMHAHVEVDIAAEELTKLAAAVFVATRSLEDSERAVGRADDQTAWGVGCHPGLAGAQKSFAPDRFAALIQRTAYVSEVGLDGKSRVPIETQVATLVSELQILQRTPRITSLHSYGATEEVVTALEVQPIAGAVLHWWLGDETQTRRALELGCFFSINASSVRRTDLLAVIPFERVLTETDHPFGDRRRSGVRRPGAVDDVEAELGRHYHLSEPDTRSGIWANLDRLARDANCISRLPRRIRAHLAAL